MPPKKEKTYDVVVTRNFGDGIVDGEQVVRLVGDKMTMTGEKYRLCYRKVALADSPEAKAAIRAAAAAKKAAAEDAKEGDQKQGDQKSAA